MQVIERYDDWNEVGIWCNMTAVKADGSGEVTSEGKLLQRTVKVLDDDGAVRLGTELVQDSDPTDGLIT